MSVLHDLGARMLHVLDPEDAHGVAVAALVAQLGPRARAERYANLRTRVAGLDLPNPVGLAAGFDKNAAAVDGLLACGFGFVEVGTVTPAPQAGNPRPRLFRLSEDDAVINRMGFNNQGLEPFVQNLKRRRRAGVVGANVGANKDASDRIKDYVVGLEAVWGSCAYVTANISSPNTPGLRGLQDRGALEELLGRLDEARARLTAAQGARALFLKVAPDLDDAAIGDIAELARAHRLDGLIVSNTTVARPETLASIWKDEAGGLSGAPLFERSTQVLRQFRQATHGALALIGAGGVRDGASAYAKILAGASAVQLYSALVYEGPSLPARIARDLSARLKADGFASVSAAVGASA